MSTPIVFRYSGDLQDLKKDNREAERIVSGLMDFVGGTLGGVGQRVTTQMKSMSRGLSQSFAAMGKFSTVAFGGILAGVTAVTGAFIALRTIVGIMGTVMRGFAQAAQYAAQVLWQVSQRLWQATQAFGAFDTQVRQTATLLPSETDKIVGQLAKVSRALVDEFNLDPLDVATAQYKTVSAVILKGTEEFLEASFKFARAGNTTADIAIALGTRFISTFQESGEAAEAFYDKVLTAVRFGILTPEEMALNLPELLPLGKAYNIDIEETLSALSTLTRQTGDAAKATTQLTTLINNLVVETRPAGRFFKEQFGLSLPKFLEEGGTFINAINMIDERAKELGISIGTALGGRKEAQLAAVGLTQGRTIFDEIFGHMVDSAGELERMFGVATGGIGFQLDNLRTEFELLKLSIGQLFSPVVGVFSDVLVWVIDTLQKVFDPAAWDPKAIISGLEDVGEWFKTLGARMWGWVQTGADYLWALGQNVVRFIWEGFSEESDATQWAQNMMDSIVDGISKWFDDAGTFFDNLQDKITAWFGLAEGTSWTEIGRFAASVIWTGIKNKLIPWFQGLGVMLQEAFTGSETNQAELEKTAQRTYQWYKDELAKNGSAYMRDKFGEDLWRAYVGSYLNKTFGLDIGYTMMDYVKEQAGIESKSWMQSLGEALYDFFVATDQNKLNIWNIGRLAMGWVWEKFSEIGSHFLNLGATVWNWVWGVGGAGNTEQFGKVGTEGGNIFTRFFYNVVMVFQDLGNHLAAIISGNRQGSPALGKVGGWLGDVLWSGFMGLLAVVSGILPGNIADYISRADASNLQKVGQYLGEVIGYGLRKALAAVFRSLFVLDVPDWIEGDWVLEALYPGNQAAKLIANMIDPDAFPTPPVLSTGGSPQSMWDAIRGGPVGGDQRDWLTRFREELGLEDIQNFLVPPPPPTLEGVQDLYDGWMNRLRQGTEPGVTPETVTPGAGGAPGYRVVTEQPIEVTLVLDGQTLAGVTKTVLIEDIHDNGGAWVNTLIEESNVLTDIRDRIDSLENAND